MDFYKITDFLVENNLVDELIYTDIEVDELVTEVQEVLEVLNEYKLMSKKATAATGFLTIGAIPSLIYRQFMTKAARACGSAPHKEACMQKYAMMANQKKAAAAKSNMSKCAKTKNPDACKAKLEKIAASANKRAAKHSAVLAKLKAKGKVV